jgi:hypothetical protein
MQGIKVIYDNGGKTVDRYTVVLDSLVDDGVYVCLALSENPGSPQGVSGLGFCVIGEHLGKVVNFSDLSESVQSHIKERLTEDSESKVITPNQ